MHIHWRLALVLLGGVLLGGCASPNHRPWGQDVTLAPGWAKVGEAAKDALLEPNTLVPLLGAATFLTLDLDDNVTDWAIENTPVFGSNKRAETYSDNMIFVATAAYYTTAMLADSGVEDGTVGTNALNKTRGMMAGFGAFALDYGITELLKNTIDRSRPNGSSGGSFPSLHTSGAMVQSKLAIRNLEHTSMSKTGQAWTAAGLYTLSGSIGWARVEAGKHYPSDVLFGYALGNFIGAFVNDAFITPYRGLSTYFSLGPESEEGWRLGVEKQF